jgi:Fic family protein
MYIWQAPNWTAFTYQSKVINPKLQNTLTKQEQLLGKAKDLPKDLDHQAEMDALIQNALQTSEIEGEKLNVGSVRSSVAKHLGLEQAGLPLGTAQTESLIAMLGNATTKLQTPITQKQLCQWQAALFPKPSLLRKIAIGELRGTAPMQVVSQKGHREIIHYQAPPQAQLQKQLTDFIDWFNTDTSEHGIIRAAIAHLWFITLHPFDDGNDRIARALTDRALAQAKQTSIRFYSLSAAIEANRTTYYDNLENTQGCKTTIQINTQNPTEITEWISWFLEVLAEAMEQGSLRIERVISKTLFWQTHSQTILNERQIKVLNRLLDNTGEEFLLGINASKYQSLTKISKATATRDLAELVKKGCLKQLAGGGRSTRYKVGGAFKPRPRQDQE